MLVSVVLVVLWDEDSKGICSVGSGFFVDKKLGLIMTAKHVLFNFENWENTGQPYFGLRNAKVIVGVIPDEEKNHSAVFRYFAEIVSDSGDSVDACVIRLKTR